MHSKTDTELLLDYRATRCETAFAEIVRRYADFVYSAALRQVGSAEASRDVAQVVFTQLAQKAASLNANTVLAGWLCRATRFAALEHARRDRRRLDRERRAMESHELSNEPCNDWTAIHRLLDEGIATLNEDDRNALLLRFFRNESLTKVGVTLGVTEDAAQKRVSRALGRLRNFLAARGIKTTAEALSVTIAANAVQAAPAGLSTLWTSSALAASSKAYLFPSLLKAITQANMKTATLIIVSAGAIAALAYQHLHKESQLREARLAAAGQARDIASLRAANDELKRSVDKLQVPSEGERELLRLRAEVTRLRREQAALKQTIEAGLGAPAPTSPPTERQILIVSKFVAVRTQDLPVGGALTAPRGGFQLMSDDQVTAVMGALKGTGSMEVLGAPRIQTANGVEAGLTSAGEAALGGANAKIGSSINVNPHYSTNSPYITLDIHAQLNQMLDSSSPQNQLEAGPRLADITNSVSIVDGQTIVQREDIVAASDGKEGANTSIAPQTLLVFLTPHLIDDQGSHNRSQADH